MVLFFALFGFLFLSTQYLQFVLGYSPSAAGVRVLPYAAAMIVFAPLSSKLVARFGTKRVTTTGMLLFSAGLAVAATVTAGTGYGRLARRAGPHGRRHGPRGRPGDRVDHGLAPARAGEHRVGGQRHDPRARRRARRRDRGQHHVVAVLDAAGQGLAEDVPGPVAAAARESLGAAVQINAAVADPAREAFVHAMSRASIVAALVAALGAVIAWRHLPARGGAQADGSPDADRVGGPLPAGSQQLVAGG